MKEASARYGWPLLVQADNAALARTDRRRRCPALPASAGRGVAWRDARDPARGPSRPGPQLLVLGGRRLAERAPELVFDGRALGGCRRQANWAAALSRPTLRGSAPRSSCRRCESGADPEADYLYFVAMLHRDEAGRYVRLPWLEEPPGEERARRSGRS